MSIPVGISVVAPPPPDASAIGAPTNFRVKESGNGTVSLVWDKSPDDRVDAYMLRYSRADSPTVSNYSTWTYPARISDNTIKITGLTNNKPYYFQVRAVDNDTNLLGNYTDSLKITPRKKYYFF